ncbi:MAG: type II toxin-antitoxin system MqsA family antitoxin [Lachnospiraceae bacterium]|jgi:YgiT-type zinc finger domain-containing protein|nr:type II toxin-antitoxin system MqsA family antitoxin [Lachnospiraceae bacterium]
MCNSCFKDDKNRIFTTFTVEYKGCIIIIRNVPCLECRVCGETTFTDEVSAWLDRIVNSVKNIPQDVSIIDYSKWMELSGNQYY